MKQQWEKQNFEKFVVFPRSLGTEDTHFNSYLRLMFFEHTQESSGYRVELNTNKLKVNKLIYLPFESEYFYYVFEMEHQSRDLGAFKTPIYEAAQRSGGSIQSIADTFSQGLTSADKAGELGMSIATEGGKFLLGQAMSSLMQTDINLINGAKFGAGLAHNNNPRMMFDGNNTKFRTFSLNWELIPRNVQEAKDCYEIESAFYEYALPKKFNQDKDWTKYFYAYTYPNKILIQPFVNNEPYNKHRFFPLVILALTISHTGGNPNSPHFYEDENGRKYPVKTQIQCTLQETKIVTRDDVDYLTGLTNNTSYIT